MRTFLLFSLLVGLAGGQAQAAGCDVVTQSSSESVKPVQGHTCYSFGNMPAEAIAWSCSNQSKEMLNSRKRPVERCADGSVGSCIAPLTQETLANPDAAGRDEPATRPAVPKEARIITYYYDTPSLGQARSDCQRNDGIWQTH
ncbi:MULTISPECIES: hypothetical protein [unclassified Pseudomonas]|uniref:hypothetical protein n=1 Tax=unclassified Pseudomonas TaxID=196821 RepID=UPI002097075D|nr:MULTISPECIES: hypothetical protein [unclassified Pseudomonas]MCO7518127.1 hypothetical protein [Pseudomonas sp. 1]MCO7541564.1 hypothetical protein [Pseudomonas sp. VA159-2]